MVEGDDEGPQWLPLFTFKCGWDICLQVQKFFPSYKLGKSKTFENYQNPGNYLPPQMDYHNPKYPDESIFLSKTLNLKNPRSGFWITVRL